MKGLNIDILQQALASRVIGGRILYYDRIGSTMDEAHRLAEEGEPEGTAFLTEGETASRGRFNRKWISPRGENLSFTVLLRPSAAQLPYVNMAATLAVSGAISHLTGLEPSLKWPNDVRIGERKVSGILIETSLEGDEVRFAVVGIGINVNFDPSQFREIAATATSLRAETGEETDRTRLLQEVLEQFDDLYGAVRGGESLTDRWAAKLETLGQEVTVRWRDQVIKGQAQSVDDQGNLLLARPDGSSFTVTAGEVTSQI